MSRMSRRQSPLGTGELGGGLIDGRGQSTRLRQVEANHQETLARRKREKERESERVKIPVVMLTSPEDIRSAVAGSPEAPIYRIDRSIHLRELGKILFGEENYNRVKSDTSDTNIGPHFDAYASNFSPWTIHKNRSSYGKLRAMFLPETYWKNYLEDTDNLSEMGLRQQSRRASIGRSAFATMAPLHEMLLTSDSTTIIWNGSLDPNTAAPAVHDFNRPTLRIHIVGQTSPNPLLHSIYAKQISGLIPHGFTEV